MCLCMYVPHGNSARRSNRHIQYIVSWLPTNSPRKADIVTSMRYIVYCQKILSKKIAEESIVYCSSPIQSPDSELNVEIRSIPRSNCRALRGSGLASMGEVRSDVRGCNWNIVLPLHFEPCRGSVGE